jgi:hypothetical protein
MTYWYNPSAAEHRPWSSWDVASAYDSRSRHTSRPPSSSTSFFDNPFDRPHRVANRTTTMEDETRDGSGQNLLRPLSTPNLASRFPSLRRINSSEPYKHRSLPPEHSSQASDRASSEITFAVLYDDGPDYHVGHFDDHDGSTHSAGNRPDSVTSFAPSFRTRDSRIPTDDHDFVANQRLLAEGYLSNQDTSYDSRRPQFNTQSEETLAMNTLHNSYSNNDKRPLSVNTGHQHSQHSRESWCTCDDDHGHGIQSADPHKVDLEKGPPTPTPLLPHKDEKPESFKVCSLTSHRCCAY